MDERVRTFGDAWQHVIGNADGLILSLIIGIVLFAAGRGGEMVFRHGDAVYAEAVAQANR